MTMVDGPMVALACYLPAKRAVRVDPTVAFARRLAPGVGICSLRGAEPSLLWLTLGFAVMCRGEV